MDPHAPMKRRTVSSGTPWEPVVGYARAVRKGPFVYVSGTTATDAKGAVVAPGDPYRQARRALQVVEEALREAGASLQDVVRTRIYLVDVAHWEQVGRAHAEVFGTVRPATTMVEVGALIDPDLLVEIEADAVVSSS